MFHLNAYDEQETLDDDAIPFLISKRKMMDKYEESRKRVVDINGTSLLKILSKEAKQTLVLLVVFRSDNSSESTVNKGK